jgi:serine/threonine protein kinase
LQLLQIDPTKRPTAEQASQHPWVKGETTRTLHMVAAIKKLREFNARRKFRVSIQFNKLFLYLLS